MQRNEKLIQKVSREQSMLVPFFLLILTIAIAMIATACGATASGTAITQDSFTSGNFTISKNGSYYLNSDIIGNITVVGGVEATLDLNGYVLKASTESGNASVITIEGEDSEGADNAASMTIQDSGNESAQAHYFKVNSEGLWVLQEGTPDTIHYDFIDGILTKHNETDADATDTPGKDTVIMVTGGCITGGCVTGDFLTGNIGNGGGICNAGTLCLNGGNVIGNKAWNGGGIYNYHERQFTLNGGNIIGNRATREGGGLFNDQGTATLTGGYICYNSAYNNKDSEDYGCGGGIASSFKDLDDPKVEEENVSITIDKDVSISNNYSYYGGGGIYICYGNVTVNGAKIKENSALNGGGVRLYAGDKHPKFTMNSGEITGNKAMIYAGFGMNGGVADLLGGSISENTFSSTAGVYGYDYCGAGVLLIKGTLNLGGTMRIYDNTYNSGIQDNLYICEGQSVTISTTTAPVSGDDGMKIGIKMENSGQFTTNGTENDVKYFTSDEQDYVVTSSAGHLALSVSGGVSGRCQRGRF